jgi:hypothetical protein
MTAASPAAVAAANAAISASLDATVGASIYASAMAAASIEAGVVAGMAAGMVAGAITGGIQGAVVGAFTGLAFGLANSAWNAAGNGFAQSTGRALTAGAIGGGSSEALGGRFQDGFLFAFGASAASSFYRAVTTRYDSTWRRGREVHLKDDSKPGYNPAKPSGINIGIAHSEPLNWFWKVVPMYEGNWLFRGANLIPGFNSFSTFHDWFVSSIDTGWIRFLVNIPSMAPALALNYASLLSGPIGTAVITDGARR